MKTLVKTNGNYFPAIPALLNEFLNKEWYDSSHHLHTGYTLPAINVRETNDAIHIEVAAPGLKRENFKVELDNQLLKISSHYEDSHEEKDPEGNYTRREFSYHAFERSFVLSEDKVNAADISATYKDGILHIAVPKAETAKKKPIMQIAIE